MRAYIPRFTDNKHRDFNGTTYEKTTGGVVVRTMPKPVELKREIRKMKKEGRLESFVAEVAKQREANQAQKALALPASHE